MIKPRSTSNKSDSGIGSSASSDAPSTPKSPKNNLLSLKDDDDILDQLARQTAAALKGGRVTMEEDSTNSSESSTMSHPIVPITYDVISLTF